MTPRRTRAAWAVGALVAAAAGLAACRVEPRPDRVALVGWLDRRYADCVLGGLRGMRAAPGPAEAVARAVLVSCDADYRAYESAFYSAYGRIRASDLWLGRYGPTATAASCAPSRSSAVP